MTISRHDKFCVECDVKGTEKEPLIENFDGRYLCFFCYDKEYPSYSRGEAEAEKEIES